MSTSATGLLISPHPPFLTRKVLQLLASGKNLCSWRLPRNSHYTKEGEGPVKSLGVSMPRLPTARPSLDARRFDEFIAASPTGCVLQTHAWGEFKARYGWVPHRLVAESRGSVVGAVSLLEQVDSHGRPFFYSPRGPVLDWEKGQDAFRCLQDAVLEIARRRGARYWTVDPEVESSCAAYLLESQGFRFVHHGPFGGIQPRAVWRVPLHQDGEAQWNALRPGARRQVRRARGHGVTVESGEGVLGDFCHLIRLTQEYKGIRLRDPLYFREMWQALRPGGHVEAFVAYLDGRPLSGALVARAGKTAWDLYAGTDRRVDVGAGYLLTLEAMTYHAQKGCCTYDLGGVPWGEGDGNDGLLGFKRRFGGRRVVFIGEYCWDFP